MHAICKWIDRPKKPRLVYINKACEFVLIPPNISIQEYKKKLVGKKKLIITLKKYLFVNK